MDNIEQHSVDGLTIDCESLIISLRRVPFNAFIMSRLLSDLADAGINVDLISRTAPAKDTFDVSVILPEKELPKVRDIANNLGNDYKDIGIKINKSITRLNLHGIGMRTQSGVAAKFLKVFADNDIQVLMITTSEICISCAVRNEDAKKAVDAVRSRFRLDDYVGM
ncbi:MAG: ACT domain-containing protein [Eubacteriaceae bacterium]|nr:ACT domain-containing protein [Eubacteriaceae bacterium]MBR0384313.1 ACT domain-containing protein [Eubacteriaceae bacterium]